MLTCLSIVILPREPQVVGEFGAAACGVIIGGSGAERIAVPFPDFGVAGIGDDARGAELVGVDVVDCAVLQGGNGQVAEPNGFLHGDASGAVFTEHLGAVVGEEPRRVDGEEFGLAHGALAVVGIDTYLVGDTGDGVLILAALCGAGCRGVTVDDVVQVGGVDDAIAVGVRGVEVGPFIDALAFGVVTVLRCGAIVDCDEPALGVVLVGVGAVGDEAAIGVVLVGRAIDGEQFVAAGIDGVGDLQPATALAGTVAVGIVAPGEVKDDITKK